MRHVRSKTFLEIVAEQKETPRPEVTRVLVGYDGNVVRYISRENHSYIEADPAFAKKLGVVPIGKVTLVPNQPCVVVRTLGVPFRVHKLFFTRQPVDAFSHLPLTLLMKSFRVGLEEQFFRPIPLVMLDWRYANAAFSTLMPGQSMTAEFVNEGDEPFDLELDVEGWVASGVFA